MSTKQEARPLYRLEGENKFFRLPNGSELRSSATDCELELWQTRASLLAALEALLRLLDHEGINSSNGDWPEIKQAEAAIRDAGGEL